MSNDREPDARDGISDRQQFARSLIDCLGADAAIDACRRNCWSGVLDAVLTLEGGGPEPAGQHQG